MCLRCQRGLLAAESARLRALRPAEPAPVEGPPPRGEVPLAAGPPRTAEALPEERCARCGWLGQGALCSCCGDVGELDYNIDATAGWAVEERRVLSLFLQAVVALVRLLAARRD